MLDSLHKVFIENLRRTLSRWMHGHECCKPLISAGSGFVDDELKEERLRLKEEQSQLLNFLLEKTDAVPPGIDLEKATEASSALQRKRKRLELN